MKKTVLVVSSRAGISRKFAKQIEALSSASIVEIVGVTDIALSRNLALTTSQKLWNSCDTIFMLDDDIEFIPENVEKLVHHSRMTGRACSGVYVDTSGQPTCTRYGDRWLTGLGCLAIPVALLDTVAMESIKVISSHNTEITCFTQSAPDLVGDTYRWLSEDYMLCKRLGGVNLYPDLIFGHVKQMTLRPSPNVLAKLEEFA